MTTSLIRRAAVFAGIVTLAISLVGQTTMANEHQGNLQDRIVDLESRLDALELAPDSDTLADLECTAVDIAVFDGTEWVCRAGLPSSPGGARTSVDECLTFPGTGDTLPSDWKAVGRLPSHLM